MEERNPCFIGKRGTVIGETHNSSKSPKISSSPAAAPSLSVTPRPPSRCHHHPDPAAALTPRTGFTSQSSRRRSGRRNGRSPACRFLFWRHEIEKSIPSFPLLSLLSLNMDGFRVESKMRAKVIVPFEEDRGARQTGRDADAKGGPEAVVAQCNYKAYLHNFSSPLLSP